MTEKKPKKKALGKGLEALFGDINTEAPVNKPIKQEKESEKNKNSIIYISIDEIKPNKMQPRKDFNEETIESLANSIKEHGVIMPVMLQKGKKGFDLIAGERRLRAARKAGLKEIPSIIKDLSPEENALFAVIENMHREDLNPIEEAAAYKKIMNNYGFTQAKVANSVGKSRPYVANTLRMLKLPDEIQQLLIKGEITAGHANAIAAIQDTEKQMLFAKQIVREKMSVRESEKAVEKINSKTTGRKKEKRSRKSEEILRVEEELCSLLGTRVLIESAGKQGKIEIHYYSSDELDGLIDELRKIAKR